MLFDHDAKVSGDSARFADLPAAAGQSGRRCVRDGLVRPGNEGAAYAEAAGCSPSPSVWAETPGMETTLTAMLFSGGRAAVASSARSAEDHATGNLVATSASSQRHLDGNPDRSAGMGLRKLQPASASCYALMNSAPVGEDRPHRNVLSLRDLSADTPTS